MLVQSIAPTSSAPCLSSPRGLLLGWQAHTLHRLLKCVDCCCHQCNLLWFWSCGGAGQGVTFLLQPLSASLDLNCPANTTSLHPAGTPVGFVLDIFDINSVWHNVLLGWIGSLTPLGCIESQKPSHPLKNTPTRMAPLAAAAGCHQLLLAAA